MGKSYSRYLSIGRGKGRRGEGVLHVVKSHVRVNSQGMGVKAGSKSLLCASVACDRI